MKVLCLLMVMLILAFVLGVEESINIFRTKRSDQCSTPILQAIGNERQSVAVCVVGEVRGFASPQLAHMMKRSLDGLHADVSTFVYLKVRDNTERIAMTDDIVKTANHINATILKVVTILERKREESNPECPLRRGSMREKFAVVSADQQTCFEMVKSHEDSVGKQFDWILKLRPDQGHCKPFPPVTALQGLSPAIFVHRADGRVHDHIAIMPRALAPIYFSAGSEVMECVERAFYNSVCHRSSGDVPNECLLGSWIHRHNVTVDNGCVLGAESFCKFINISSPCVCVESKV
jgi:hypothetical protein